MVSEPAPILITVEPDNPVTPVQPTMWDLFYEDINFVSNTDQPVPVAFNPDTGKRLQREDRVELAGKMCALVLEPYSLTIIKIATH